jgi:hypothetical protein
VKRRYLFAAASVFALAACETEGTVEGPAFDSSDVIELTIADGFDDLTAAERVDLCLAWLVAPDDGVAAFEDGYGSTLTASEERSVRRAMDRECSR